MQGSRVAGKPFIRVPRAAIGAVHLDVELFLVAAISVACILH